MGFASLAIYILSHSLRKILKTQMRLMSRSICYLISILFTTFKRLYTCEVTSFGTNLDFESLLLLVQPMTHAESVKGFK